MDAQQKNQIDQKMIEDTIQTILVDVVDELTENEARKKFITASWWFKALSYGIISLNFIN